MKKLLIASCLSLAFSGTALAQSTCTDEQKTQLAACVTACETTCQAQFPGCTPQPITLEQLRAAIAEECDCSTAKNYGKFRSCVAHLLNALRKFSLIDDASKAAIGEDNKLCRDQIKERRKTGKGNKGGNSEDHKKQPK